MNNDHSLPMNFNSFRLIFKKIILKFKNVIITYHKHVSIRIQKNIDKNYVKNYRCIPNNKLMLFLDFLCL